MAHDTHASTDPHAGEAHPHPALPPVTDEAPDSPAWLPAAGLGLLTILVLFVLLRGAMGGADAGAVDAGAVGAEEAGAAAAVEDGAPIRAGEPGAVPVPAPAAH